MSIRPEGVSVVKFVHHVVQNGTHFTPGFGRVIGLGAIGSWCQMLVLGRDGAARFVPPQKDDWKVIAVIDTCHGPDEYSHMNATKIA
jgi:hypothetical protein